jgi:hypothetical protein
MKRFIFLPVAVAIIVLLYFDYQHYTDSGERFFDNLRSPETASFINDYSFKPDQLSLTCNSQKDANFSVPFQIRTGFWKRLRVDFSQLRGIKSITVFYRFEGDPGFPADQKQKHRVTGQNKYSYDFLLPPGDYSHLRFDFDGYRVDANVGIKDLRLLEYSAFFYTGSYFHLLTLVILALLIVPGTMMYSMFTGNQKTDSDTNLLLFFCLSIIFYLVLYLVLEASHRLDFDPRIAVGSSLLLLLAAMILILAMMQKLRTPLRLLWDERKVLLSAAALSVLCGILMTGFVRDPFSFDSINWDTIDGEVVFSHFTGHDNMFQYVNGMAIANNEPFSKYYEHGKLMAGVQDREILAGVIYSVFRTVLSAVNPTMGEAYLTYTLVGLCMNLMAIFPLVVLLRRYHRGCSEPLFLLLLVLNTFVLANLYFTWFKFAGAALFVSGTVILLKGRKDLSCWLFAGLAYGLATNMHAGNALGIPLIFLYLIYANYREDGLSARTTIAFPLLLFVVFLLTNTPWSLVKSLYYPDGHVLFKYHYLPGSTADQDLVSALRTFLDTHPPMEQFRYRLTNLYESLRFSEFIKIYEHLNTENLNQLLYRWSNSEFSFFSIAIYPMVLIALFNKASTRLKWRQAAAHPEPVPAPLQQEITALMTASFATVIGLILLSYHNYPDATFHLPMGIILMILTLLLGYNIRSGPVSICLLAFFGGLAAWRTGSLFLHFL